jgi:hypothetical protein
MRPPRRPRQRRGRREVRKKWTRCLTIVPQQSRITRRWAVVPLRVDYLPLGVVLLRGVPFGAVPVWGVVVKGVVMRGVPFGATVFGAGVVTAPGAPGVVGVPGARGELTTPGGDA